MKQFIEMTNKYGYRSYINVNHILSVDETGENNRCLVITDLPPSTDTVVPFYYTVDEPYDVVVGKILQLNEE